ncbi:MAG: hypothetical protein F4X66_04050 [Chloroflexi bacterium]|nr:hypothetical protein [Chloroflexota bacterium]MYE41334.1 hypothetical protein [Chloroflexota bacterium]
MNLPDMTVLDLLLTYEAIDDELLRRRIQEKRGEAVGGYTERLVCLALKLRRMDLDHEGFDAIDEGLPGQVIRYQIKGRRDIKDKNPLLSSIGDYQQGKRPFDFLVGVVFGKNFHIRRAAKIEYDDLWNLNELLSTKNGRQLKLTNGLMRKKGVQDITNILTPHRESVS